MLKKIISDKKNDTKNTLSLLQWIPTHHSLTFNLLFLKELKHKVHLSKIVCGTFYFRFRSVFIKVYIFLHQNTWTFWLQNVIIPLKIKIIEKAHTFLLLDLWILSYSKKFWNSMMLVALKAKFWYSEDVNRNPV